MRRALAVTVLGTVTLMAGCAGAPAGLVGQMSATSDVAGQPGDAAVGGGGLAVIPIAAMNGPFWDLAAEHPIADPQEWFHMALQLSEDDVTELGGTASPIDGDGGFRLQVAPAEYAVCYWPGDVGTRITGCDAIELPASGTLEATWGEAGFQIRVAG
ncbi:hypothetical protein [Microbacterium sp. 2FI]|uniref:hypothetical protein n=1 Tax=Microbacterium sp. 2FI TaxID=2502193 RepID=UPI0010F9EBE8|nr:hypothetical protein [Microbacterium sp. 2FI]